jgi:hypothetical protein
MLVRDVRFTGHTSAITIHKRGLPRLTNSAVAEVMGCIADAIGTIIADPKSDQSARAKRHASAIMGSVVLYYALDDVGASPTASTTSFRRIKLPIFNHRGWVLIFS